LFSKKTRLLKIVELALKSKDKIRKGCIQIIPANSELLIPMGLYLLDLFFRYPFMGEGLNPIKYAFRNFGDILVTFGDECGGRTTVKAW
jgi:hypothetical protein